MPAGKTERTENPEPSPLPSQPITPRLAGVPAGLRALLREHTRITHDQASRVLVQLLDTEHRLKHAS